MKISINNKTKKTKEITNFHLTRPISYKELIKIMKNAKEITMSKSTYDRLSKKSKELLKNKVKFTFTPGKPIQKNIYELKKVIELYKLGYSYRKIEEKTNIPKSTIHYLIKKAKKNKIKYNDKIIYL